MADLAESLAFARQHLALAPASVLSHGRPMAGSTLITVAPTGAEADKAAVPALPVTLAELVVTAKECEAAGAAVIHVHIRDDAARPTLEVGRLADTVAALREGTGLIVQLSTGGAVTDSFASRLAVLDAAPDACSLTCGTVNFGDDVFSNPWPFIKDLYQLTQERQVVPEFELFDLGQIATLHRLLDRVRPASRRPRALRSGDGRPRWHAGRRGHAGRRRGRAARGRHLVRHRHRPHHPAGAARCPRAPAATCGSAWRTP